MIKTVKFLIVTLLLCALMFVSAYSQDEMEVVDNSVFERPQRSSAVFLHDAHNEAAEIEDCAECHHVYENGQRLEDESSEDQRCADCHTDRQQDRTPALMKAYHANCKGCHRAQKAGPVMCGECHRW